jgi:DNA-binding XRE family transcriptional regulator
VAVNQIQEMTRFLSEAFSEAKVTLDEPIVKGGVWLLNVFLDGYHLAITWQEGNGFGVVADDDHGYGEGADEVYDDSARALPRVVKLLAFRLKTVPPEPIRIKELREELGLSQEELGRKMGRKQASISRFEARSDFHLSTLQDLATAFGGKLVVKIVFSDATERELNLEGTP